MIPKKISRRALTKHLGLVTGTASLFGPGVARALVATPRQVEGPFYPPEPHVESDIDLTFLDGHDEPAAGEVIYVRGRVTDTRGTALANARVDIWQTNHWGRYTHPEDPNTAPLDPNFQGIGIAYTDDHGRYGFKTIKPAAYPLSALGDAGWRARHIHFKVADPSGRELTTQMYFDGDPLLEDDEVFNAAPAAERHLLVTTPESDAQTGTPVHRFDISLADADA
jgi:protocatechuate 3,4-dioxygenase beta subunit